MPFDVQAARAAGYSDSDIADYLSKKNGFDVNGARKSGYNDAEIVAHLEAGEKARGRESSMLGKFGDQLVDNVSSGVKSVLGPIAGNLVQSGGKLLRSRAESGAGARDAATDEGFADRAGSLLERGATSMASGLARTVQGLTGSRRAREEAQAFDKTSNAKVAGQTTWQDVKDADGFLATAGKTASYALDSGIESIPGMAVAAIPYVGVGLYGAANTGNIAMHRAENDGRADPTLGDVLIAAPAGIASAYLERTGTYLSAKIPAKTALGGIGKAAAAEAGTEFLQSGTEYAGGSIGTKQGFDAGEALDQSIAGGIAGAGMGATIRGAVEGGRGVVTLGEKYGPRALAVGTRTLSNLQAGKLTPEDEASPIPNEVIQQGKIEVADAAGKEAADAILAKAGMPATGKRVTVTMPDGTAQTGTVFDAFDTDAGKLGRAHGIAVQLDNGTMFTDHFDTLRDVGVSIAPIDSGDMSAYTAEADAMDAALAARPDAGAGDVPDMTGLNVRTRPPEERGVTGSGKGLNGAVLDGLRKRGLSEHVARGVAAGIQAESRSDPNVRGGYKGRALGIGQWLGERRAEIIRRYGENPTLDQQLDFLVEELNGRDAGGKHVLAAQSDADALNAYITKFMRPAAGAETDGDLKRGAAALGVGVDRVGGSESIPTPEDMPRQEEPAGQSYLDKARSFGQVVGDPIDNEWSRFSNTSGTLNVPRDQMPQIKAEHRGAMVNFLNARGVAHEEQDVPASSLKPTQAEFSNAKVKQATEFTGGNRAILTSSDGYVLDGHHQWMAALSKGKNVRTIKLDAPIAELLKTVPEFPSATDANGSTDTKAVEIPQDSAIQETPPVSQNADMPAQGTIDRQDVLAVVDANNQTKNQKHSAAERASFRLGAASELGIDPKFSGNVDAVTQDWPDAFERGKKAARAELTKRRIRERSKGSSTNGPSTGREQIAQSLADALGHGRSDFHGRVADAILGKDFWALREYLAPHNKKSRKVFAEATGVRLPDTKVGTQEALRDWAGISQAEIDRVQQEGDAKRAAESADRERKDIESSAANTQVRDDKGNVTTIKDFIDQKISEGFDRIENFSRGAVPKYYLANADGRGFKLTGDALRYARQALETMSSDGLTADERNDPNLATDEDLDHLFGKQTTTPSNSPTVDKIRADWEAKGLVKPAAPESTAPEHAAVGVDDRELSQIVDEFNSAQASMNTGDEQITHVFDAPKKSEIVRLGDKTKVYHQRHGWMTPAEAKAKIAEWKAHAKAQGGPGSENADKIVLSLFDLSGEWSKPWEEAGYQVYRFDIQADPEVGDVNNFSTDFFGDWFGDFDGMDIYAILAACPCTDFAVSGARHFAAKDADGRTVASVRLVHQTLATIEYFKPAVWAIENPVGRIEKLGGLPPWRLSFNPNDIGETYTKKTLLWGRFNADMPIAPVVPVEGSKMHSQYGGKSLATKNARSVTPEGFAYSFFMANNAIDNRAMAIANKFDRLDRSLIEQAVEAGVTEEQITSAVEDFYYQELDDDGANAAIRNLIPTPPKPRDRSVAIIMDPAAGTVKTVPIGTQREEARRQGIKAWAEGKRRVSANEVDPGVRKEWYAGWDAANLAAPLENDAAFRAALIGGSTIAEATAGVDQQAGTTPVEATSLDDFIGKVDAGYRVHYDYAGTAGRTIWLEKTDFGWTVRYRDDAHPSITGQMGGAGASGGWSKSEALKRAEEEARYRFTDWKPTVESALSAPTPTTPSQGADKPAYGQANKLFTQDAAEKARALLRAKRNQLNSGFDPEIAQAGLTLMGYHIEAGARSFIHAAQAIAADLGVTPADLRGHLRGWYANVRMFFEDNGHSTDGMDDDATVKVDMARIDQWGTTAPETAIAPQAQESNNGANAEPAGTQADDLGRDAERGARDVSQPQGAREAGASPDGPGRNGDAELSADGRGRAAPDRAASDTGRADAGERPRKASGDRNRNQPGDRVPNGPKPERSDRGVNYLAPSGTLKREGGWRTTAERNLDIVELVNRLDAENRQATPEEQELLVKFTGWGASEIRNNLFRTITRGSTGERQIVPHSYGDWKELTERASKLLTGDLLETALQSTQYAHYTSEQVIRSIWAGMRRLGFNGGKIVEPGMGTGLFAVAAPKDILGQSNYTGIELDGFTAKIAQYLLPQETVLPGDYTKTKLPDGFFDIAIGNPPFANVKVTDDPAYKKHRFSLHDYFFAKTIDKVRPGGLLVFVTSRYTMDKLDQKARQYIADRADLLAAIRLPQTAFKENAGTEVVTDVLFLQRRAPGAEPAGAAWLSSEPLKIGGADVNVNSYYLAHPEMVLGKHATTGSMYRANEYTVEPGEGSIEAAFGKAIENLPENVYVEAAPKVAADVKARTFEADMRPSAEKEGGIYLKDGVVFRRENGVGRALAEIEDVKLSAKDVAWLKDYIPLRDAVKEAQRAQLDDGDWEGALKSLNKVYDTFVKKHGQVSTFTTSERTFTDEDGNESTVTYKRYANRKRLEMDVESSLAEALEKIDDEGKISKSPFLLGRTLKKPTRPVINTAADAVAVALDEIGRFDLPYVAKLLNKSEPAVVAELGDEIFQHPDGSWLMADEYLSGDVVAKLDEANVAAKADPRFERNVKALIAVQPRPLTYSDISVKLGAGWIEPEVVEQFATEVLGESLGGIRYEQATGNWTVPDSTKRWGRTSTSEWATEDRSTRELLDAVLNNRTIKVTRTDKSDGKTVTWTDTEATALANERAKKISDRFKTWIWTDGPRATRLVEKYNRMFNNLAPRKFDGKHLTFPGLSTRYKLFDHQRRAIWRVIATGNTYLNHAVGAGKTLEMIVSGMEQRRLGLIRKPMYVVPNHMLNQFAREFLDAYPAANIMVADENAFHTGNRRRFMAQAALNDPDAVIVTHSSFGKIQTSLETRQKVVDRFIAELEEIMGELKGSDNRIARSKIEKQIEQIRRRFEGKAAAEGKDKALTFEDMGVDFVFVDEAHEFRKLDFATNRTAVKGIDANGSQRSLDLYTKLLWLNEQRPGRAAVLASGTPVTNTMAEIFTVMRYMDQAGLERDGLAAFDAWAAMFGEVVAGFEQNAAGSYEMVERFSKFVNVPEMMKRVRSFMDVLTSDQLGDIVVRPALKGGLPENVIAEASPELERYMKQDLLQRIEVSRKWKPSKDQPGNPDPIINIITDGRLSAIDMRFVDPMAGNDPDSKLNKMIDKIIAKHREFADVEYTDKQTGKPIPRKGSTQIVFSAVGFGEMVAKNRGFDARAWIDKRLAEAGVPKDAVAWMSDQNSNAKKEATFKAMRNAEKRVLIGSPKNMGTGVNVQSRLKVLHFLSPPWYPSDVEQPHGRIIRQGNMNTEAEIYWYATKGTYDSTAWNMVSRKQRFIEQAMRGDDSIRSLEDISEANQYEMASALAAGDERVIQLAGLSNDIERLTKLKAAHAEEQVNLKWRMEALNRLVDQKSGAAARLAAAIEARGKPMQPFALTVDGARYEKPGEAGQALIAEAQRAVEGYSLGDDPSETEIGRYLGSLPVVVQLDTRNVDGKPAKVFDLVVRAGPVDLTIAEDRRSLEGVDPTGLAQRVGNAVNRLEGDKRRAEEDVSQAKGELAQAARKIGAPFEYESELGEKIAEREGIQSEMAAETEAAQKAADERAKAAEAQSAPNQLREDGEQFEVGNYRSPFRAWFRNSVVFDGVGDPMPVHHWTYENFTEFDPKAFLNTRAGKGRDPEGIDRIGSWFSGNPDARYAVPSLGGKRMDVYLRIENPLWLDDVPGGKDSFTQLKDMVEAAGGSTALRADLKAKGHDGIIMSGTKLDGYVQDVYIAFDPEQIKSATDNSGAFDPTNPSILAEPGNEEYQPGDGEEQNPNSGNAGRGQDRVPVRGRGEVRALGIADDIRSGKTAALVGQIVTHPSELAELAQVYRDPRHETFRVFFLKGVKVVHASGVSARLSDETPLLPGAAPFEDFKKWMEETMASSGADGFYLMHNHPSGDPVPSKADKDVTTKAAMEIPGFKAHVVINSGKYAVIAANGRDTLHELNLGVDRLLRASKPHAVLGETILDPAALARVGKAVQREGYATIVGTNKGKVRVVVDYPISHLNRPEIILLGALRRIKRMSGSSDLFIVGDREVIGHEKVKAAYANGLLTEGVDNAGRLLRDVSKPRAGMLNDLVPAPFTGKVGRFVAEDGPRYNPGEVSFDDTETERRFQDAKAGLDTPQSWRERAGEWMETAWHGFTRHWVALPNVPKYAALQQKLRAIESAPQHARERTVAMLEELVKDFTKDDLDLFTRKVILDDLSWDASHERDLPFGFTPETLLIEKQKVDAAVMADPDKKVWNAVMKRKVANRRVAQELVAAGVLEAEQIKNPAYYRHQVLEYARAQAQYARTPGKKLRTPKWAKRMGSTLDINANLLEAEFDWLNKAFIDIPVAQTIEWIKKSEHNILEDLRSEAKASNKGYVSAALAAAQDVIEDSRSSDEERMQAGALIDQEKRFRQHIAMGFNHVRTALEDGEIDVPRQFQRAADAIQNGSATVGDPPFAFLAWMLDNDQPGAMGAAMIMKAIGQRRTWTKALLGRNYIDPQNADELVKRLAPEGYRTWQPDEGKLLFTVKTLPEHVIDAMIDKLDAPAGIDAGAFRAALEGARSQLAMGGDRYTMILPEEVADTLSNLRREELDGMFEHFVREPVRWWKRWVLINPRRVFKYNLNNLTGDLDAVVAGNPHMLRRVKEAAIELANVRLGKERASARYEEAVARGVFDSGLSVQEIPDINQLAAFERFANEPGKLNKLTMIPLRKAWNALQGATQWRENIFRYAAYLDYADRIEAGESQASIGYGASVRGMVDAVTDPKDRAALLARDLLGDYGAISHFGSWLRGTILPFWSWTEINTKRYWRLTANASAEGIGKGLATGTTLAVTAGARRSAWLFVRMAMMYGLLSLWNGLFFPDEEEELGEQQRAQMHVILGRNANGEIITLRAQGALGDALAWFGLSDMAKAAKNYELGRGDLSEILLAAPKATLNKLGGGLSPMIKAPVEAMTGKILWPDMFSVRENRDPWRNTLASVSLDNEYDAVMGNPTRGYGRSWQEAFVYRKDPGEMAYNEARGIAYDWLKRERGQEFAGGFKSPRSEAMRDYRTAIKFGDQDAAGKAYEEMARLGVDRGDYSAMMKRAAPLGPIAKKDRAAFIAQLTPDEYATMQRAQAWYDQTFLGARR